MAQQFPSSDSALLAFGVHFSSMISATLATYGLVAAQATAFATLVTNFQSALAACEPTVRSKTATAAKNAARSQMNLSAQQLINIINGQPSVTNAQKIALGINVRSVPTPIPTPGNPPELDIVSVTGRTVKIRMHNNTTMTRARPAGVTGCTVFSYVGTTPPADMTAWNFEGNTSKTVVDVLFPSTVAGGSAVWLTAFWYNGKGQSGPACAPVTTYLAGGSVSAMAA
jgi:hypothetical protein